MGKEPDRLRKEVLEAVSYITELRNLEHEWADKDNQEAILSGVDGVFGIWITSIDTDDCDIVDAARIRFQVGDTDHPSPSQIEGAVWRAHDNIGIVRKAMTVAGLETRERTRQLDEVQTMITHFGAALIAHEQILAVHRGRGDLKVPGPELDSSDSETLKPLSKLLLMLLEHARENSLRRYKGAVYTEVLTIDGFGTHAWELVYDSMTEYIHTVADRTVRPELWTLLTSAAGYISAVEKHLLDCEDPAFPRLRPDRHLYSFQNGVYSTAEDNFYPYGCPKLAQDKVSCKYVDTVFDYEAMLPRALWEENSAWTNIDTPVFAGLLDHQGLSPEVQRWMYAMLGRMLYAVGEKDKWQVAVMIKGTAGTGKSTILNVIKLFYADADIGVLSNNIEKKFGLAGLADKLAVICYEVKASFGLDQAELQAMISGERIQVARKNKSQLPVDWMSHLFFAGNELAAWVDAAGSMARRFLMFEFDVPIDVTDTSIGDKLEEEMPALLLKCNLAYLEAVKRMGTLSLSSPGVLPSYFAVTQARMLGNINTLVNFLEHGDTLALPPPDASHQERDKYTMPLKMFKSLYATYCDQQMIKAVRPLNSDAFTAPFARKRIRIVDRVGLCNGERYKGPWLHGVSTHDMAPGGEDEDIDMFVI